MALAWYGSARALLELELDYMTPEFYKSSMITGIVANWYGVSVGTIVTQKVLDFTKNTTRVSTGFVELQLAKMRSAL
jgi:hypothetical protein